MGVIFFADGRGNVPHYPVDADPVGVGVVEPCPESVPAFVGRVPVSLQSLGEFSGVDAVAEALEDEARGTVFEHAVYDRLDFWVDGDQPVSSGLGFYSAFQSPFRGVVVGDLKVDRLGDSEASVKKDDDLFGEQVVP